MDLASTPHVFPALNADPGQVSLGAARAGATRTWSWALATANKTTTLCLISPVLFGAFKTKPCARKARRNAAWRNERLQVDLSKVKASAKRAHERIDGV